MIDSLKISNNFYKKVVIDHVLFN